MVLHSFCFTFFSYFSFICLYYLFLLLSILNFLLFCCCNNQITKLQRQIDKWQTDKWNLTALLHCFVNVSGCHCWEEEIVFRDGFSRLFTSMMSVWKPCMLYNDVTAKICEEAWDQIIFHIQVSFSHSYYTYPLHCTDSCAVFCYCIWISIVYVEGSRSGFKLNAERGFVAVSCTLNVGWCWGGRSVVCSCLFQLKHSGMSVGCKHLAS